MSDERPSPGTEWRRTILVVEVALMRVNKVVRPEEPLAFPSLTFGASFCPSRWAGLMRRKIKSEVSWIVAVVRNPRIRTLSVGSLVCRPPVITRPHVLTHAKSQTLRARGLSPFHHNIAFGAHVH